MSKRVTTRSVVFVRPFVIDDADGEHPAGIYTIETEEELLESVSIPAWRRISTTLHYRAAGGITRFAIVDPAALDAALARDRRNSR